MKSESHARLETTGFDQTLRGHYRQAQQQVSSATMAELHRRRIEASTTRAHRHFGWPLAAAVCGVFALAIGLGPLLNGPDSGLDQTAIDALDAIDAINLTALDEDPDFLAWLVTNEAMVLAME